MKNNNPQECTCPMCAPTYKERLQEKLVCEEAETPEDTGAEPRLMDDSPLWNDGNNYPPGFSEFNL